MTDKEYVEKESLARHIENSFSEISTPFHVRAIRNFPAADKVVEVVRCKDCVFCVETEGACIWCSFNDCGFDKDGFCSHGERRRIMSECKYRIDEMCANADCPYRADFCPVEQDDSICRYRQGLSGNNNEKQK